MASKLELSVIAKNQASAVLRQIGGDIAGLGRQATSVSQQLKGMGQGMTSIGTGLTAGVTAPVLGVGLSSINAAADMEQLDIAFTTMLGSASEAKKLMEDLTKFSAQTPFEMPEVVAAGRQLLAFGIEAEDIETTLRQLGDVAAGVGAPIGDLAYLYGTASASGRLMTVDINQFAMRGIPIIGALAQVMGVAESQVRDMAAEGEIGAEEMKQAFALMGSEGGKFAGLMAAQSQSVKGLFSTVKDNVGQTLTVIGNQIIETFDLKRLLGDAIVYLEQMRNMITDLAKNNPALFKMAIGFGVVAAVIGPVVLGLGMAATAVGMALPALSVLGGVLSGLALPFAAVGAAAVALYYDVGGVRTLLTDFGKGAFDSLLAKLPEVQAIGADVAESIGNVVTAIQDFLAGADISAATTTLTQSFTGVKNALGELFTGDIGISEFASKISDAVSGIPAMVSSVFAGADFSAMKGEIITALGLDNVSFDLSALQTNISTAIGSIDWSQVAAQFNTLKDSVGTALNSVRDGVLSSLTAAVNGIDWSAISLDFAGMIDSVTSTINGIDWSQISIEDIGLALAGVVMPVLTNSIRGIVWVLNSDSWSGLTASVKSALASIEWGEIGQSLSGLGAAAIDAVTGLDWSTITGAFESLRSSVSSTISGLDWSTVTGAFGTLVSTVTGALSSIDWSTVATEFNSLKTSVVTAISDIDWTAVATEFNSLKTSVVTAISDIDWAAVATEFNSLKTSVVTAISDIDWAAVATEFNSLKTSVVTAISDIDWAALSTTFESLKTSALNALSGIDWSGVSTGFTALKTSVSTAIANIDWAGIAQNLNGLAAAVSAGVSSIDWSGVSSAFDALKTTVSSTLTGINWSEVLQNFVASANTLRDNLIQSLADKINGIDWSAISLDFAGFINKIASTISSIDWSQAVVNVAGFISSISSKISSIDWSQISVGAIGAALAAVVAPALTAGIAGIAWVISSENWGNLLSAVTGSIAEIDWGPIGEAFGNLATAVVDSVTDIDWSPINFAFGSLVTSVENAITNLDWSSVSAPFYALKDSIQNAVDYALSTISFGFLGGGSPPPPPPPPTKTNASGTKSFEGGLTWVDERGAELFRFPDGQWAMGSDKGAHLMDLPKGTEIYSHEDSKKMLGMGGLTPIGQNADGTTTAATVAPTGNGNVFSAIASAANNFVKAGDKLGKAGQVISDSMKDLEANLRKVPGVFGASQVTEQQMKMGALGVPQNFADDWLRRLTDEVVNGVNWEGVDIKDAALRAGLDPGLPAEAILELVTQKWNDKSLFANAANLDLINQDAIKQALETQAQQAAGEQNLLNLFGVTPEQARTAGAATGTAAGGGMLTGITQSLTGSGAGQQVATSIATGVTPESIAPVGGSVVSALATELGKEEYGVQMGAALAGLFTGYLDKADAFVDVAQRIMSKIAAQFSNVGALDMVARFVESFRAQLGSKDAISSLTAVGEKILELVFRGYLDESLRRNWAEGVNAKGDTSNKQGGQSTTNQGSGSNTNTPPTTAGNAIGTSSWRGGMTWVGETGPELVSLPPRTRIFNPAESMALAGGGGDVYVTVNATVSNAVDVEQLAYRVVDVIRKRR
jgi:tape measure domain-containing protein